MDRRCVSNGRCARTGEGRSSVNALRRPPERASLAETTVGAPNSRACEQVSSDSDPQRTLHVSNQARLLLRGRGRWSRSAPTLYR
jgi:hypothetical protein